MNPANSDAPAGGDDAGMTLVEILVFVMLLTGILVIAGGILIGTLTSQRTVTTVGSAATAGQLVAGSIEQGIRNASAFQVGTPTAFGQLLRSRSVDVLTSGAANWQCRAWFRTSTGQFYTKSSMSAIPVPTTNADLSTWTLVTTGVNLPAGTAQGFTASSNQLVLSLSVDTGAANPVLIKTTILSRPQTDTGTAPATCF